MGFDVAVNHQAYIKASIYGGSGSGKTFTGMLCVEGLAKREKKEYAVKDTEHGTDPLTLRVPSRKAHPDPFVFRVDYGRGLAKTTQDLMALDPKKIGAVMIDSLTHLWRAAINSYSGPRSSNGELPREAWTPIKQRYGKLIEYLMNCPMHVILVGRMGARYEMDESGEEKVAGWKMKAEAETGHETPIEIRMEQEEGPKRKNESIVYAYIQKDRGGVMQGHTIPMPTYKTLMYPMTKLLTAKTQAHIQTEDETSMEDAEAFSEIDHARQEKSLQALMKLRKLCNEAKDKDGMKAFRVKLASFREDLTPTDMVKIRIQYLDKNQRMKQDDSNKQDLEKKALVHWILQRLKSMNMNTKMRDLLFTEALAGRKPGWPDEFTLVDLRIIKRALDERPRGK